MLSYSLSVLFKMVVTHQMYSMKHIHLYIAYLANWNAVSLLEYQLSFIVSFRANGEQLKAQVVLNISSWEIVGNSTNFSYSDIPEPSGYLDTTTNIYIYSGKAAHSISVSTHSIFNHIHKNCCNNCHILWYGILVINKKILNMLF